MPEVGKKLLFTNELLMIEPLTFDAVSIRPWVYTLRYICSMPVAASSSVRQDRLPQATPYAMTTQKRFSQVILPAHLDELTLLCNHRSSSL